MLVCDTPNSDDGSKRKHTSSARTESSSSRQCLLISSGVYAVLQTFSLSWLTSDAYHCCTVDAGDTLLPVVTPRTNALFSFRRFLSDGGLLNPQTLECMCHFLRNMNFFICILRTTSPIGLHFVQLHGKKKKEFLGSIGHA